MLKFNYFRTLVPNLSTFTLILLLFVSASATAGSGNDGDISADNKTIKAEKPVDGVAVSSRQSSNNDDLESEKKPEAKKQVKLDIEQVESVRIIAEKLAKSIGSDMYDTELLQDIVDRKNETRLKKIIKKERNSDYLKPKVMASWLYDFEVMQNLDKGGSSLNARVTLYLVYLASWIESTNKGVKQPISRRDARDFLNKMSELHLLDAENTTVRQIEWSGRSIYSEYMDILKTQGSAVTCKNNFK